MVQSFPKKLISNTKINFDLDEQAQDGNGRPWFTFVLIDLPLKLISAKASVSWHLFDGDDVKLIIDNNIEENATLSYMSSSGRSSYTHFEDWFSSHHEVNNFIEKVYAKTIGNKYYLFFDMMKDTGEKSGQEKFLFTGSKLILEP